MRVPVPSAGVVDIPITEKAVQGQQQHYKVSEPSPRGLGFLRFLFNHILISLASDDAVSRLPHGQWEDGESTQQQERTYCRDSVPCAEQHSVLRPRGAPAYYR